MVKMFTTLREAQVLIESWRRHYNAGAGSHLAARPWPTLRFASVSPRAGQSGRALIHVLVPLQGAEHDHPGTE